MIHFCSSRVQNKRKLSVCFTGIVSLRRVDNVKDVLLIWNLGTVITSTVVAVVSSSHVVLKRIGKHIDTCA